MIANWLSKNVSKFNTILCSAGMMVPWLPNSAVADLIYVTGYSDKHDTGSAALTRATNQANTKCKKKNGDPGILVYGKITKHNPGKSNEYYTAKARIKCWIPDLVLAGNGGDGS